MLTSKPELSPFDSPRSLEGTLGLEVVEDLSLLPSQNSVPLNLSCLWRTKLSPLSVHRLGLLSLLPLM